ncbi:DUF4383 domain-containing protein [Naasia lichenicola]|uniref:DUF4383 domain-containing protein n=1 Tax=Naasia lichenicola TaxID=2565933 RepID=A0A4S4FJB7_9MICO|nr:DUF4383 domain-containing protein [Naasia lichenicola]THG30211.1 DUF4383 domain-containing protein [Naasia lichenicola]
MRQSPNRLIGTVFGAVYLLVGFLGFAYTSGVSFISPNGGLILGIFEVNPLHNAAHLLIGAALLIAGISDVRAARATNGIVGVAYLALGIVGFFLAADPNSSLNFLALNMPDHFLHLGSAVILGGAALGADKATRSLPATAA